MLTGTADYLPLDRANPAQRRPAQRRPAPEDLARRLLEQIAAGAIWASATTWARNTAIPDTAGNHLDPTQRATALAALDMITDWRGAGLVAFTGVAGDDGMFPLELRPAGHDLLAALRDLQ